MTRSTMTGFACLRLDGDFFASVDHRTGSLVVKLDESTVDGLLAAGDAEPVAPSGKRFCEWASTSLDAHDRWEEHLREALEASVRRRRP